VVDDDGRVVVTLGPGLDLGVDLVTHFAARLVAAEQCLGGVVDHDSLALLRPFGEDRLDLPPAIGCVQLERHLDVAEGVVQGDVQAFGDAHRPALELGLVVLAVDVAVPVHGPGLVPEHRQAVTDA
jgi:hypothetical protein